MKIHNLIFSLSAITCLLSPSTVFSIENTRAFVEYQSKNLSNTDKAQDLGADWSSESLQQIYGEAGFDYTILENKLEVDTFFRQIKSGLLEDSSADNFSNQFYPLQIVARDVFKMQHSKTNDDSQVDIALHRMTFSWGDEDVAFTAGRMFINYGEGHTINPINPFNHNSNHSNIYGVNQANDGVRIVLKKDSKLKLHLYFFGDKSFTDYDEEITRTVFLRGNWEKSKKTHINYILGEDQKRHKYGAEIKHSFGSGFGFIQLVRISQQVDKQDADSKGLFHSLGGYEFDINQIWTTRLEIGKFEKDEVNPIRPQTNFLPFESFIALNNLFRVSDNAMVEFNLVNDSESKALFYKFSSTYKMNNWAELRIFLSGLTGEPKDEIEYASQNFIPAETGLALRGKF
jgi:hypothetical protein